MNINTYINETTVKKILQNQAAKCRFDKGVYNSGRLDMIRTNIKIDLLECVMPKKI
jgi:hypothetical protein